MPARILDLALAFLGTCATATRPIGPSDLVDIGWHTFTLYTRDYADFCDRAARRFIQHVPGHQGGQGTTPPTIPVALADTVSAIRAAGFTVDPDLWPRAADCTQCHAGSTDSPSR